MKIWFEKSYAFSEDDHVMMSVGWYKHYKGHPYKGFTINIIIFEHLFMIHYVNNYQKYQEVMNRRYSRTKRAVKKILTPPDDKDKV